MRSGKLRTRLLQQVWHDKDPTLIKGPEHRAYYMPYFAHPHEIGISAPANAHIMIISMRFFWAGYLD
jgi:hypothetical protein